MLIQLLIFARLREALGVGAEQVALPPSCRTVGGLLQWLRERGEPWATELGPDRVFRVAVDQELAHSGTELTAGAEVAIFPLVTGG